MIAKVVMMSLVFEFPICLSFLAPLCEVNRDYDFLSRSQDFFPVLERSKLDHGSGVPAMFSQFPRKDFYSCRAQKPGPLKYQTP